ncbi:MAG: protein kinase domain-containing protein [Polyangiales bacterium]
MQQARAQFGVYETRRRLGVGGMAETFVAVRRGPGGFEQQVCLKRVLPAFAQDEDFVRLFQDEARLVARLRHNNIVQLNDFGEADGSYYLALELIDGVDLKTLFRHLTGRQDKLAHALLCMVAYDVASALDHAHNLQIHGVPAKVVHRDVSPGNILLSRAGEVKLADFGIAAASTKAHVTQSGVVKGKVPYMSPEQARGEQVDGRSDLFSLGVVLYEGLAQTRPFDGATEAATLLHIVDGKYSPIETQVPGTPAPLARIIGRLLQRERDARYPDAAALLDDLAPLVPPPTVRRQLAKLVREAALAQLTPGGAAGGAASPSDPAQRPASHAQVPAARRGSATLGAPDIAPDSFGSALTTPASGHRPRSASAEAHAQASHRPGSALSSPAADDDGRHSAPSPAPATTAPSVRPAAARATRTEAHPPATARRPASALSGILIAVGAAALGATATLWLWPGQDKGDTDTSQAAREAVSSVQAGQASSSRPDPAAAAKAKTQDNAAARAGQTDRAGASRAAEPAPKPTAPATSSPAAAPSATGSTGAQDPGPKTRAEADAKAPKAAPPKPRRRAKARLQVAIIPWGNIWIDGVAKGRGPVNLRLKPGTYHIAGGYTAPTHKKTIRLRAGERRQVILNVKQ